MTAQPPDPLEDTQAATEELRAVLRADGIVLPELAINLPAVMAGYPLVNLGSADTATVRKLIKRLRAAPH